MTRNLYVGLVRNCILTRLPLKYIDSEVSALKAAEEESLVERLVASISKPSGLQYSSTSVIKRVTGNQISASSPEKPERGVSPRFIRQKRPDYWLNAYIRR